MVAFPCVLSGLGYGNAAQLCSEAWTQPEEMVKTFNKKYKSNAAREIVDPHTWPKPKEALEPNCAVRGCGWVGREGQHMPATACCGMTSAI